MADNQTSLNENLIAAGLNPSNPTGTYVDFAEQIAKNQQEQASQEQALALAKEHVAQAKLQTKQGAEADAAGVNPLLMDVMTPEQAVAYLKLILKEKGMEISEDDIDTWAKTLKGPINRQVVETFANRFARQTTHAGTPAKFDKTDKLDIPEGMTAKDMGLVADPSDPQIGHVPEDGMYSVLFDNEGKIKRFIPAGKEAADPTLKLNAKAAESTEKQWQKLDKEINTAFKTRSGGLGSLSTAIFRSVRAINTINSTKNLTAQDLANISQDIAGVFQGGAPTVVTAKDNDYSTIFTNLADTFRKYTGIMPHFGTKGVLQDTKAKLLQVCVDLRDSATANIKKYIESEEPAFKQIIDESPERWDQMQEKKLSFITSGLLLPSYSKADPSVGASPLNITGMDQAEPAKDPNEKPAGKVEGSKDDKKAALRKKLGLDK